LHFYKFIPKIVLIIFYNYYNNFLDTRKNMDANAQNIARHMWWQTAFEMANISHIFDKVMPQTSTFSHDASAASADVSAASADVSAASADVSAASADVSAAAAMDVDDPCCLAEAMECDDWQEMEQDDKPVLSALVQATNVDWNTPRTACASRTPLGIADLITEAKKTGMTMLQSVAKHSISADQFTELKNKQRNIWKQDPIRNQLVGLAKKLNVVSAIRLRYAHRKRAGQCYFEIILNTREGVHLTMHIYFNPVNNTFSHFGHQWFTAENRTFLDWVPSKTHFQFAERAIKAVLSLQPILLHTIQQMRHKENETVVLIG
jgi:hypothetical protein